MLSQVYLELVTLPSRHASPLATLDNIQWAHHMFPTMSHLQMVISWSVSCFAASILLQGVGCV